MADEETIFHPETETVGEIVLFDFLRHETRARRVGMLMPITASCEDNIRIDSTSILIGRDAKCDFVIGDESVSRRHVRITPTRTGFIIEDLKSSNGTYVDAVPIETCVLHGGDSVQIGRNLFLFEQIREYSRKN